LRIFWIPFTVLLFAFQVRWNKNFPPMSPSLLPTLRLTIFIIIIMTSIFIIIIVILF
jgi:hypothetical protein